uniref:Uncharacterized protein n=1 Tax=Terrapene triunguis TaxID=2587831 RepID=A0A674ITM3_9SAUR
GSGSGRGALVSQLVPGEVAQVSKAFATVSTPVKPLPAVNALVYSQVLLSAKLLPQSVQWCGRTPVCMRWCILRLDAKPLPHSAQQCGRSPVCVCWCDLRSEICAKAFPQSAQRYGRSPLCAKPLLQSLAQRNGCSPVCVRCWL